jgi:hypothetical protein
MWRNSSQFFSRVRILGDERSGNPTHSHLRALDPATDDLGRTGVEGMGFQIPVAFQQGVAVPDGFLCGGVRLPLGSEVSE